MRSTKIRTFTPRVIGKPPSPLYHAFVGAGIFFVLFAEIAVAASITLSDYGWRPLPCSGSACALLHQDPLLRNIPLGTLGLFYGVALASLVVAATIYGVAALRMARGLSYFGSLVSMLLIARGMSVSGGYCPWCLLHAVLCVSTSLLLTLAVGDPVRVNWRRATVVAGLGLVAGFGAVQFVLYQLSNRPGVAKRLAAISRSELLTDSISLTPLKDSPPDRVKFVVFAELDCGMCVALMREIHDSPKAGLVRVRFAADPGPGRFDASFLQLNLANRAYPEVVKFVVEDNPDQLEIERFCREFPGLLPPTSGPIGVGLSNQLDLIAFPTIVKIVDGHPVLSSDEELRAALG